ncbi:hypothetical protein Dsin_000707 [Dipteronia sinensis]|uniref:Endonuclease/exonuclease/phosphatase domain-containing protein n=1 Tax=Dipteronia sinensis TaxID=43782 RepID=A0AAE0B2Z7_9ROSI|nr:hypothetical protein Dsin_000707 [Dipteronia sinensis]
MEVVFCNVYAPNMESERKGLWDFIENITHSFSMPWCLGGDFNTVLDPSESKGGECNMGSARNFNLFISRSKVVDIPLHGITYTWTDFRERVSWARLDRFLISPAFLMWYPRLSQKGLLGSLSDHNVVTIGETVED